MIKWLLLLSLWLPYIALAQIAESDEYGKVGLAKISGMIDRRQHLYFERVIDSARKQQLDTLIVHIDTDGGEVFYAREMLKLALDQVRDGPRLLAFVDFRAISAGALIAYGHEAIYISETATIGDIGVIFVTPGEGIQYAPEKIETVVRALLAQAAEQRGWNRGLLMKMTAHKQLLYRVTLADDSVQFVIEDDMPEFLAEHPEIDKKNSQQVIVYRGKDRLLTLTGREAVQLDMATGLVPDLDALYQQLAIDPATVVDLKPTLAEQTAFYLAGLAPIFAGLALLFILFELQTPGVGIWAMLGALCGALFLLSQFYLDMINYLEILLIILGAALLIAELLTLAGGGLLGVVGAALMFTGLALGFLPDDMEFDFNDPRFVEALSAAALNSLLALAVLAVGFFTFIATLPRTRLARQLAVQSQITATSAGTLEASANTLLGRRGIARDALHPSGIVIIADEEYSASAEHGAYIESGTAIEVVKVQFGELVVRAREASE